MCAGDQMIKCKKGEHSELMEAEHNGSFAVFPVIVKDYTMPSYSPDFQKSLRKIRNPIKQTASF